MPSYTGRNVGEGGGGSGAPDTMSEGAHASEWSTDPVEIVRAVYPQLEDWVDASEEPESFEATCGPRLDTPMTYLISDAHLTGPREVSFSVDLPPDFPANAQPSTNQCVAVLVRDGTEYFGAEPFTLSVPPGKYHAELGASTPVDTSGLVPTVVCEPFDGHVDELVAAYTP
jgi:hypothetical protein